MVKDKKELAVAALKNGTVIDHIPSESLFQVVDLLGLQKLTSNVTIGFNLSSSEMGKKGIIKIADIEYPEDMLNRIALIAPTAVINIIKDYEVVEKKTVETPDELRGIVKCNNPVCICNNEPMLTIFNVIDKAHGIIKCHYCDKEQELSKVKLC